VLFEESVAVTCIVLDPRVRAMLFADHEVVPVAVPPPEQPLVQL